MHLGNISVHVQAQGFNPRAEEMGGMSVITQPPQLCQSSSLILVKHHEFKHNGGLELSNFEVAAILASTILATIGRQDCQRVPKIVGGIGKKY